MKGRALEAASGDGEASVAPSSALSLIKRLASCDKVTRDRALKQVLKAWLPSQKSEQVSDDELKKLWKGLFYCVWHADKAPVQMELISRLSSLLVSLPVDLSLRYLSVFLLTMRREWTGIDHLRLDKFYLLIRRFINASFRLLKGNSWDLELSRQLMRVLEQETFCADDNLLGNGVNYHIASVFLDELKPFLPLRLETLDAMFKPFLIAMTESQDKVLVSKISSNVFDVLLKMGRSLLERKKVGDETPTESRDDVLVLGTIALNMSLSEKFYDSGSSPDCFQGNRKVLLSLHVGFMKLEKDLASAGVEISNPDVMVDEEDFVPELIPITQDKEAGRPEVVPEASEEGLSAPTAKLLKNKRKSKKTLDPDRKKALDGSANKDRKKENNENKKKSSEISETGEAHSSAIDKDVTAIVVDGNMSSMIANGESSVDGTFNDENNLIFNKSVISNLQRKFEKIAAEIDLDKEGRSHEARKITIKGPGSNKRKRTKNMDVQDPHNLDSKDDYVAGCGGANVEVNTVKSEEKSAKKVRFSMKNNLVWKPHSPLPPQNLRLPPSLTPRGSALKKGVPPGPILEMPPAAKKPKTKKERKRMKAISVAIKRLRRLRTVSV